MKITQYCSVCREELEMEVVPTEDEEEDGVLWLRCPGCRGFLPKIGAAFTGDSGRRAAAEGEARQIDEPSPASGEDAPLAPDPDWDEGAEAEVEAWPAAVPDDLAEEVEPEAEPERAPEAHPGRGRRPAVPPPGPAEPLQEYAARLAEADLESSRPYRPWDNYEVGDVVHHLAWSDQGIVVAKESLPGGRKAVKVYFDQAGLVRLIENADVEP